MCVNKTISSFEYGMEARPVRLTKGDVEFEEKVFISDFPAQITQYTRKSVKSMVAIARGVESTVGYK